METTMIDCRANRNPNDVNRSIRRTTIPRTTMTMMRTNFQRMNVRARRRRRRRKFVQLMVHQQRVEWIEGHRHNLHRTHIYHTIALTSQTSINSTSTRPAPINRNHFLNNNLPMKPFSLVDRVSVAPSIWWMPILVWGTGRRPTSSLNHVSNRAIWRKQSKWHPFITNCIWDPIYIRINTRNGSTFV